MDEYWKQSNGSSVNGFVPHRQFVRASELVPLCLVEDIEELKRFGYALLRDENGDIVIEDGAARVSRTHQIRFQINGKGLWKPLFAQPDPSH